MTRRDLVVLAADKDMEHALRGLLSRHKSLPIRQIAFDIFVHPQHDAACATRGVPLLSPLSQRYQHALLILDHEGSGRETMTPDDLQAALNQEFRASAWSERGKAIVLAPELETWVWSGSPHVAAVAGWAERRPRLRQWLNDHGLWNEQESKPPRYVSCGTTLAPAGSVATSTRTPIGDAVRLMAKLVFQPIAERINSGTYLLYDGACGTGGMLTVAEETLRQFAAEHGKEVATHLYGPEINAETYAICKADLLVKGEGEPANNIVGGPEHSTLSNDALPSQEFDFMLSNPPYGKSWKTDL